MVTENQILPIAKTLIKYLMWENREIESPIVAETLWQSIRQVRRVQRMLDSICSSNEYYAEGKYLR